MIAYAYYLLITGLSCLVNFGLVHEGLLADLLQSLFDWRLNGAALGVFIVAVITSEQASNKILAMQEVQALRMEALQAQTQREILKERNTLIDVLTHELKTPLGTMRFALASLAREHSANPDSSQRVFSCGPTFAWPNTGKPVEQRGEILGARHYRDFHPHPQCAKRTRPGRAHFCAAPALSGHTQPGGLGKHTRRRTLV